MPPTEQPLIIRSSRVVTPRGTGPAAVVIADGTITEVADHDAYTSGIDLGDVALLPGPVDPRAHAGEGFSVSLCDAGVPGVPVLDKAGLRAAMTEIAGTGLPMLVHAEDPGEVAEPRGGSYDAFVASRPTVAERRGIETVISAAAATGARAHIAPLAAADCAALIGAAKAAGIGLTAETCPHYLCFAAEEITGDGTEFRCRPPIRYAANREALWRALAEGVIDCVVPGQLTPPEIALAAVWTVARKRGHTLADVARWMSAAPAELAGLAAKGAIARGRDADLVAFDPDAVCATSYLGRTLTGQVVRTWQPARPGRPAPGA